MAKAWNFWRLFAMVIVKVFLRLDTSEELNQGPYSQEYLHVPPQTGEGCCLQGLWLHNLLVLHHTSARLLSIICRFILRTVRPAVCPAAGALRLPPFWPSLSLPANAHARIANARSVIAPGNNCAGQRCCGLAISC
jgi:hypothetical protein